MRTIHIQTVIILLMNLASSGHAGNNTLVLSGALNHHFSTTTSKTSVANTGFPDAYSISLHYNRQLTEKFGAGIRMMLHNLPTLQEDGVYNATLPALLTFNYRLFEMGDWSQVQLAAGPVFHIISAENFESGALSKSFETGYGVGIFSGYDFGLWGPLGIYAESGLLYEKYDFKKTSANNTNVTAIFSLGFAFTY